MRKLAFLLALASLLLLGGGIAFIDGPAIATPYQPAVGVDDRGESPQATTPAATDPCTHDLNLSYADGTLTLGFELGVTQPSAWNGAIVFPVVRSLWSTPIPPVDPPVNFDVSTPFPSIGPVIIVSWVVTSDLVSCVVFDAVNTGAASSSGVSADDARQMQDSIRQASKTLR